MEVMVFGVCFCFHCFKGLCISSPQDFLLLDEISQRSTQQPSDDKMIVHVQDFTASWDKVIRLPFVFEDLFLSI